MIYKFIKVPLRKIKSEIEGPDPSAEQQPALKYRPWGQYTLRLEDLYTDPALGNHYDESELEEMAWSVKDIGVIKPIFVRKDNTGKLTIIKGEKRFRGSMLAGKDTIPAIYIEGVNPAQIAPIVNLQRASCTAFTSFEDAQALYSFKHKSRYNNFELSAVTGKSRYSISLTLKLFPLLKQLRKNYGGEKSLAEAVLFEVMFANSPVKESLTGTLKMLAGVLGYDVSEYDNTSATACCERYECLGHGCLFHAAKPTNSGSA